MLICREINKLAASAAIVACVVPFLGPLPLSKYGKYERVDFATDVAAMHEARGA